MISVAEAHEAVLSLVTPLDTETVSIAQANGRWLASDAVATRNQPPFAASAMDGYALNRVEADLHAQFQVIGEAAAGHGFTGKVGPGQCVRIFTGAPVPEGADFVVIQENTSRQGKLMTITDGPGDGDNIRPAGSDFTVGTTLSAPRALNARDVALMASMNIAHVTVRRRPVVAIMATGDELVAPGGVPTQDQIIASNSYGLKAMAEDAGAQVRLLPIAQDSLASLSACFDLAQGADLIVTIGGASVGDHDLVAQAAEDKGLQRSFYKIAMRPGKPLMAGRMGASTMLGLPGNPVSSMVCGTLFMVPMIRAMQGDASPIPRVTTAIAGGNIPANGPREHYMRAHFANGEVVPFDRQDSSLLTILQSANALLVRPPHAPAASIGETVNILAL